MKFHIEFTDKNLQNNAGLSLFSKFLLDKSFINVFKRYNISSKPSNKAIFSDLNIIHTAILLLANGFSSFENIDHFKNDLIFRKILGTQGIPAKETFRQRLNKLANNNYIFDVLAHYNLSILKTWAAPKFIKGTDLVPLDCDVSIFDNTGSNKEGVSQSYKVNIKGFAPMLAYIGAQGYSLNLQFRKGSAHSNTEGTCEFLIETAFMARQICKDKKILVRLDSGNDADSNIIGLSSIPNTFFIIKHQLRGANVAENAYNIMRFAAQNLSGKIIENEKSIIYFAEQEYMAQEFDEDGNSSIVHCRRIISIVEITHDLNTGERLLIPQPFLHMWRTNLPKDKYEPHHIVELYKDHATCEQFHSEFKTDLDVERMPSSKFNTNDLWIHIVQITFNILRLIGEKTIEICQLKIIRQRLRTVILKIIYAPCWFTRKNKKWTIFLPRSHPTAKYFMQLHDAF